MNPINKYKELFNSLDFTNLKIMQTGFKICFCILLISILFLSQYISIKNLFLFNLGLTIFKFSTYLFIEFIICGLVADTIYKQLN